MFHLWVSNNPTMSVLHERNAQPSAALPQIQASKACAAKPDRGPAHQPGTPDGTPMADAPLSKEFLSDQAGDRDQPGAVVADLELHVLVKRPFASGAKYRSIWNEELLDESPAPHHHAEPGGESAQGARFEKHLRRLGHALRLAVD
jgi:hypothetical protein